MASSGCLSPIMIIVIVAVVIMEAATTMVVTATGVDNMMIPQCIRFDTDPFTNKFGYVPCCDHYYPCRKEWLWDGRLFNLCVEDCDTHVHKHHPGKPHNYCEQPEESDEEEDDKDIIDQIKDDSGTYIPTGKGKGKGKYKGKYAYYLDLRGKGSFKKQGGKGGKGDNDDDNGTAKGGGRSSGGRQRELKGYVDHTSSSLSLRTSSSSSSTSQNKFVALINQQQRDEVQSTSIRRSTTISSTDSNKRSTNAFYREVVGVHGMSHHEYYNQYNNNNNKETSGRRYLTFDYDHTDDNHIIERCPKCAIADQSPWTMFGEYAGCCPGLHECPHDWFHDGNPFAKCTIEVCPVVLDDEDDDDHDDGTDVNVGIGTTSTVPTTTMPTTTNPTPQPTSTPTTARPTLVPTTSTPTSRPSKSIKPTPKPTIHPTVLPPATASPTSSEPTPIPTPTPTTTKPTPAPISAPTPAPSPEPTPEPTSRPTTVPAVVIPASSFAPTPYPTTVPGAVVVVNPSQPSTLPKIATSPQPISSTCTVGGLDPWRHGVYEACCPEYETCLNNWNFDDNYYYLCLTTCDRGCTRGGEDPWQSGGEIECCEGFQPCLGDWNDNTVWNYLCLDECPNTGEYPSNLPDPIPDTPPAKKRGLAYREIDPYMLKYISNAVSWAYTWETYPSYVHDVNVWYEFGVEFVPMIWGEYTSINISHAIKTTALMSFNEPNHVSQSNMHPSLVAQLWRQLEEEAIEHGIETLVGPSLNYSPDYWQPVEWLRAFFDYCHEYYNRPCRVDALAVNTYVCTLADLKAYLSIYDDFNLPIWITEFACVDGPLERLTAAGQAEYMVEVIPYLENNPNISRYAWLCYSFTNRADGAVSEASLVHPNGTLTKLGAIYSDLVRTEVELHSFLSSQSDQDIEASSSTSLTTSSSSVAMMMMMPAAILLWKS